MTKTLTMVFAVALGVIAVAGSLQAKPALKDVEYVREGLIATGIAIEISQKCSGISPRYFRGISYLNSLKDHAAGLGYSEAEIDAYTNDKAEENRLKEVARTRLSAMGAIMGDGASYCNVGQSEIAKNTPIGRLLR
tara:strand:- start:2976 stop:3383 length:408 start_codon:yes stop_codon:yes gene_type:complete